MPPAAASTGLQAALLARIDARTATVGVVGLGYVGLPLAVEFAHAGFQVVGYDVSERVVGLLSRGESHIQDVPASAVADMVSRGQFVATMDESLLATCHAICIAVPTPLVKTRDPDMSFVLSAADAIARQAQPGVLVSLESTTYPGTTRELLQPRLEERGLVIGETAFLAFSPERVDPGNATWNTKNTPKVVGGVTPACTTVARALYAACIDTIVTVGSPEAAELVKLLENTFRSVNIGLANEMAVVCDRLGVDVWEVINAAATKPFGFMKFTPGPGIGGHCIPLDPHYLAWKMRTLNYRTRFIDVASEINSEMPEFVVRKVNMALNQDKKPINGSRVLVIGVAYKRDIDDVRESPALDIIKLLEARGAAVQFHDPHVVSYRDEEHVKFSVALTDDVLRASDAVVIITDHTNVDYAKLAREASLVVDTRNAMALVPPGRARIVPLAGGMPFGASDDR